MARNRELRVVITGDPRGLSRAFASAERSAAQFGGKVESVGSKAARSFGLLARAGAGAAGLGFGAILKAGVEFEKQMARVQGVSSATGQQMKTLTDLAKDLGARTRYSAGQAAEAMYELASAGFGVADMSKVLPGTLSLAAASGIELKDAAEISANALKGFGLQASDMAHVGDVLATAVNTSSVEMGDLQLSLKYIGPIAKLTGQSFEDMIAAVDAMGNAGVKGEQAGTTLRAGLIRLVKPTKQVEEGLSTLGLRAEDLQGPNGLKPLPQLFAVLESKLKPLSQAQRAQALTAIFGTEAASGMSAALAEGSRKLSENSRALKDSDGAAKRAADTMNNTVAGAWENFTGSIETASISLYDKFKPALKDALTSAAGFVNGLDDAAADVAKFFDRIRGSTPVDPLTGGGGEWGNSFSMMLQEAVSAVDWQAVGDRISTGISAAMDFSGKMPAAIAKGINAAVSDIDGAKLLGGLVDVVGQALEALFSPKFWIDHFAAIFSIVTIVIPVGRLFKLPGFSTLYRFISAPLFRAAGAVGRAFISLLGRIGSQAFTEFLAQIERFAPRLAGAMLALATSGAGALRAFPGLVVAEIRIMINLMADAIGQGTGRAAGAMARLALRAVDALGRGAVGAARAAGRIVAAILGKLDELALGIPSRLAKALAAGTRKLRDWVGNFGAAALAIGKKITGSIIDGIGSIGHAVFNKIKGGLDWAVDQLKKAGGAIGGFLGIGDGIGKSVLDKTSAPDRPASAGASGSLKGADAALRPFAAVGARYGLHVSSGKRAAGSRTSSNGISYHGYGEAIDLANGQGPDTAKLNAFRALKRRFGSRLAELIYTPGGVGIKNGRPFRYTGQVAADHFDHVHVALDLGRPGPGIGDGLGRPRQPFTGDGPGGNVRTVWEFLRGKGLTPAQVAGIIGVMQGESGPGLSTTARNRSSGAYGIAQWLGGRLTALMRRPNPSSLQTQLTHLWSELQGPESAAFQRIRGAHSIDEAVNAWLFGFERPGPGEANLPGRTANARRVYSALHDVRGGGTAASTPDTAGPSEGQLRAEIERNTRRIEALRSQARHLPTGRAGRARRVAIQDQISALLAKNRTLRRRISNLPAAADEPTSFERQSARAELGVAEAEARYDESDTSPQGFQNRARLQNAKLAQQRVIQARIQKIRQALRKRGLRPATRVRLQQELAGLVGQDAALGREVFEIGTAGRDQGEPITQEDILNAQVAQAALTPDTADDQAAAAAMLDYRQGRYLQALQGGDPREIAQTAQDLKTALDANTQSQEEQRQAMEEHTAALKSVADELKAQTDFAKSVSATEAFQLKKLFADWVAGGVGALTQQRSFTPGIGTVAAY